MHSTINMTVIIFLLIFVVPIFMKSCYNKENMEVISSLMQSLNARHCILVRIRSDCITEEIKLLSEESIYAVYFGFNQLIQYLKVANVLYQKVVIVIKADDKLQMKYVLKNLKAKISDKSIFSILTWMLMAPENHTALTAENFYVPFDCQFFLVEKSVITEIYQLRKKSKMIYSYFGNWSKDEGLNANVGYLYKRRNTLLGQNMIMMRNNHVICRVPPECLHLEIWEDLAKLLNFTTKYVKIEDFDQGDQSMMDASTNISVFSALSRDNHHIVGPMLKQVAHVYIKKIEDADQWDSCLRPFNKELWMVIVIWIIISSMVFILMAWFASSVLILKGFTVLDQGLTPLSVFCNQASSCLPIITSSRIATISAYAASAVIFPAYSGSLISYLTVHIPKIPFTDLESFVRDGTYKLSLLKTAYGVAYFKYGNEGTIRKIREKQLVLIENFPISHTEEINMICEGNDISIISYNYRIIQMQAPCKILLVSDVIYDLVGGIRLYNEAVHYRKLFQTKSWRFHSSGIISKMQKTSFGKTKAEVITELEAISIIEVKFLMVFLVVSFVIVMFLFTGEYVFHKEIRRKYRRKIRMKSNVERIVVRRNENIFYRSSYVH